MLSSISHSKASLAVLALTLSLVGANPVPAAAPEQELATRGPNEALYLANCQNVYPSSTSQASQMAYYSNGRTGSQHGEQPDNFAWFSSIVTWEGRSQTANFQNNGGSATSNIQSGAGSYSVGAYAGSARNSYGQNFNCYKDNGRTLYTKRSSSNSEVYSTCYSIYYCYDA